MTSSSAPLGSYAHGTSEIPLLGETIGESLRRTAERFPAHEALVVGSQSYRATWRELWDETTRAARGLLAAGVAGRGRVRRPRPPPERRGGGRGQCSRRPASAQSW